MNPSTSRRTAVAFALATVSTLLGALPACSSSEAATASAAEEFNARTRGDWLLQFKIDNPAGAVYVNDKATYADNRFTLFVEAFLDEARTTPFLRYEASFAFDVVGRSPTVPDAFLMDIRNESAKMTALVDEPALFVALGLDDCGLRFNQAVDVSKSACGAPSFRDGSCVEKDIYQVAKGARVMLPAAGSDDRCVTRPTAVNPELPYERQGP